ncbi:MAG: hypothetical protein QJR08_04335 [Bacillota bacterium]|nr:hypothetical protein [Bacillota bacterium]
MPSSSLSALRSLVRSELQEPQAAFWSDSEINQYINEAVQDLGRVARIAARAQVSVSAGQALVSYPSDFQALRDVAWLDLTNALWPLARIRRGVEPDTSSATPTGFIPDVGGIRLWPTPSAGGSLILAYWRRPARLSADTDTSDLPGDPGEIDRMIVDYAVARARRKDDDPAWVAYYQTYQMARAEYRSQRMLATAQVWDVQSSQPMPPPDSIAWIRARGYAP